MQKKIIFNNTEYLIDLELGKLTRIFRDKKGIETNLVSEYVPNLFATPDTFTYALSNGELFSLDLPSPNKSLNGRSVENFVKHGRNPIFYKVTPGQIMKIGHDTMLIFKDKESFSYLWYKLVKI